MRFLSRTPVRTFFIYPVLVIAWKLIWNRGSLSPHYPAGVLAAHGMGLSAVPALWSLSHQTWWRRSRPRNPRTASSQPDLTPIPAIRCISVISLPSRIEFGITLLARRCDHDRRCVVVSRSSHRRRKKLSNQARQALPGVYEESPTLDLKEQSWR